MTHLAYVWFAVVAGCVLIVLLAAGKAILVTIEAPRTAVALEFVIDRDDTGEIIKIHRFILWSNGDVSFPNIPYYAKLLLNCRDCPKVPNPCPGDLDGDGVVATPDLLMMMAAMGEKCPD